VIFDQINLNPFTSRIRVWNATTHTFSAPPGVNTAGLEDWFRETADGLDARIVGRTEDLPMISATGPTSRDLVQGLTDLDLSSLGYFHFHPEPVRGNWAVWAVCRRVCNVYRYDIGARTRTRTTPPRPDQYAPSVTADGTVYFVHSGAACGQNVRLVREPLGGGPHVLVSFKPGHDVLTRTQATPDASSGTDLYYDKLRCTSRTTASDIYEIVVP
jgi:hypothetical protein